jgi:hypothetical protein
VWKILAIGFTVAAFASLILLEVVRAIVNRIRVKKTGFGGTQDIAVVGLLITGIPLVLAFACWAVWLAMR